MSVTNQHNQKQNQMPSSIISSLKEGYSTAGTGQM